MRFFHVASLELVSILVQIYLSMCIIDEMIEVYLFFDHYKPHSQIAYLVLHVTPFASPFELISNFVVIYSFGHTLIPILKLSYGASLHIFGMGGFVDICDRYSMLVLLKELFFLII